MREYIIDNNSSGQRLDRFVKKVLPEIPSGLLQKSIRKKNIKVNNKKADAKVCLEKNDKVQIYFSDETIKKFSPEKTTRKSVIQSISLIKQPAYEDENFIVINKPAGLLSQPDSSNDESVSDLIQKEFSSNQSTFSPAPLNRLDRNTSGIIIIPKNYQSQKEAAKLIRNHNSKKRYLTLVKGEVTKADKLTDQFSKDRDKNKVSLTGKQIVELEYRPIATNGKVSLIEVDLKTGKSHQIRAQLQKAGYPLIGDPKYGDKKLNKEFNEKYGLTHQLLHAYEYILGKDNPILEIKVNPPKLFGKIVSNELEAEKWLTGKSNTLFGEDS